MLHAMNISGNISGNSGSEVQRLQGRTMILAVFFVIIGLVFIGRLVQVQIFRGESYRQQVAQARLLRDMQPGQRGRIVDRHGVVLVDNRIAVDACLPLRQLALPTRHARRMTLWEFAPDAKHRLLARLSTLSRFDLTAEALQTRLHAAFATSPLVGRRRVAIQRGAPPELFVVPQTAVQAFVPRTGDAELLVAFRSEQLASLAAAGTLRQDIRAALAEQLAAYYLEPVSVLTAQDYQYLRQEIMTLADLAPATVDAFLLPVAEPLQVQLGSLGIFQESWDEYASWYILPYSGQKTIVDALSLATEDGIAAWQLAVERVLFRLQQPVPVRGAWLTDRAGLDRLRETVADLPAEALTLEGLGSRRQYIDFIQDEGPGSGTGFVGWCRRLAAAVGVSERVLIGVVRETGVASSVGRSQARFRVPHLVLDDQKVAAYCAALAGTARAHGMQVTPLEIRHELAVMRLLADRGWRAQTVADPLPVLRDIPPSLVAELSEVGEPLPADLKDFHGSVDPLAGMQLRSRPTRSYAFPGHASHLFGTLGRQSGSARQVAALGLDPAGWVGRSGIEAAYDEQLQGVSGRRWSWRGSRGYEDLPDKMVPARPGETVQLTIDMELQLAAEAALANWAVLADDLGTLVYDSPKVQNALRVGHGRAGMALMDVHRGELLALASYPQFDLRSIRDTWSSLADPELHPERPLNDYAVEGWESPGSTVKPLVALAALHEGLVRPDERISSQGYMARTSTGGFILRDHMAAGHHDLVDSLAQSSNVVFAKLAKRLTPEQLAKWYRRLGMGRIVAPDVPWQRPGVVPDPATRKPWHPAYTWFLGIGQNISSSPLQVVTIPALVATGSIVTPHLVRGAAPSPWQQEFAPAHLRVVQRGMEAVTGAGGTAPKLRLEAPWDHIKVAAKTGTSEWSTKARREAGEAPDNAWLIAYAPAERPQVALAIFIRCGTSGGRACSGVAKAVLERYFARYGVDGTAAR